MSYFPVLIEVNGVEKVIDKPEHLPNGQAFKIVETNVQPPKKSNYEKYTQECYFGTIILQKHKLFEMGVWEIRGEDPNCDFGGYHHAPYLDTVSGTLESAIRYAVELEGFWQWGSGGEITKKNIKTL